MKTSHSPLASVPPLTPLQSVVSTVAGAPPGNVIVGLTPAIGVDVPAALFTICTVNLCWLPTAFTPLGLIVIAGWQSWN